jgi:hypothetical protein
LSLSQDGQDEIGTNTGDNRMVGVFGGALVGQSNSKFLAGFVEY